MKTNSVQVAARQVFNPNVIVDFGQFKQLVERVDQQANRTRKDVQALLNAAAAQCLSGNANWVNELLKRDFRGMKREAMVAWLLAFAPIKVVARDDNKRVLAVRMAKGWASEECKIRLSEGYNISFDSFKTEASGEKVAEHWQAERRFQSFMNKLNENIGKVPAEELMQLAIEMRNYANDMETSARIKVAEQAQQH